MNLKKLTALASLTLLSGSLLAAPMPGPDEVRHEPVAPAPAPAPQHDHAAPGDADRIHRADPHRAQPQAPMHKKRKFQRAAKKHNAPHKIHRNDSPEPHEPRD
ncbi:MAG: hypothetical protein Q4A84_06500 [Neisseria sp.]|uniref:hypothetical protein n=1 Tax=Neisseria sp. TaxID=192066 RepID=UPI0026DBB923|nr:hypothetical protein [Neisseria sp.]MDO4641336.1 hypothetical protein [Neisseria sp.]